jgi:hypothetical protein
MFELCGLVVWVVALAAMFSPESARANGDSTRTLIVKAEGLYGELQFEGALRTLAQALANRGNTRPQLVQVHLLRGICLGSIGRYGEARRSFAKLLALDPSFRMDRDIAPRIRAPFEHLLRHKPPRLDVHLLPPHWATSGEPVVFTAHVEADTLGMTRSVQVWFRHGDMGAYSSVRSELRGEGERRIQIPNALWEVRQGQRVISWYAVVQGENESQLKRFGDELHPLALEISERADSTGRAEVIVGSAWYRRWWVWAIVGVVAAGTATAVVLATATEADSPHDFGIDILVEPK